MDTQLEQIHEHLIKNKSITPMEALKNYGCYRLGARIYDLRCKGLYITTHRARLWNPQRQRYVTRTWYALENPT